MKKKKNRRDLKAEKWADRNTWFGKHKGLTNLAMNTHEELVILGLNPRSNLYYDLINMVMYPFLSKSAKLKRNYGKKKTIHLTEAQVEIAKKLGVPLKAYARELRRSW